MITPSTTSSAQQSVRQAADGLLNSADKAMDATRSYANQAMETVDEKIHALQNKVEPALDKFTSQAQSLAHQGIDMAANAKDKAKESLSHYSAATTRYVSDKPMQSVLIAAAVGAAVALLVSATRHRSSN
jgi:ElaB/YqjD/DUF883 family membrane-anchored ribosome-binding protein